MGQGNEVTGDERFVMRDSLFANRLSECAYRYFWDIDPASLDVSEYPRYVIERLLEYGDLPSVRWMESRFSREEIVEVLKKSRRLSAFSANFWALIYQVKHEDVLALRGPSWRPVAVSAWRLRSQPV